MKETYRPLAPAVLTLKTAAIPLALSAVTTYSESTYSGSDYLEIITPACSAAAFFLLELMFLGALSLANNGDLHLQIKKRKKKISKLQAMRGSCQPATAIEIDKHISRLEQEMVRLTK